jgi:phage shock protein PspC (stress-responsive transcriptional regulator)
MIDFKHKRLYRRPNDAIVLGIAAGLGEYLSVDPVFVRLVWLVLAVFTKGWPMALLYVVLFFVVPIDPSQDTVPARQTPKDVTPEKPAEKAERMDENLNM